MTAVYVERDHELSRRTSSGSDSLVSAMFDPIPSSSAFMWVPACSVSVRRAEEAIREARDLHDDLAALKPDPDIRVHAKAHSEAEFASIRAVLLTAIHIEGAINAWGVVLVGQGFFELHIERSSPPSKLALLIALSGHGRIPNDHDALARLRRLFRKRNDFAHPKTVEAQLARSKNVKGACRSDLDVCDEALGSFRELFGDLAPPLVPYMAEGSDLLREPDSQ